MKGIFINVTLIGLLLLGLACEETEVTHSKIGKHNRWRHAGYDDFLKTRGQKIFDNPKKFLVDFRKIYDELRDNFTYMGDEEQYGKEDYWTIMPDDNLVGDDEDFVLTLRERLVSSGFNKANVRIARCYKPREDNKYDSEYLMFNHVVALVEIEMGRLLVADTDDYYNFYRFPVVSWYDMLDETGDYWVKLDMPGNSDKME